MQVTKGKGRIKAKDQPICEGEEGPVLNLGRGNQEHLTDSDAFTGPAHSEQQGKHQEAGFSL